MKKIIITNKFLNIKALYLNQKIIVFILLFFITLTNNAQTEFQCDFVPTSEYFNTSKFSNRMRTIPDDGRKFVLNIKFHYILGANGENPSNLSEAKMFAALAMMNVEFNSAGVFFKYRGSDFVKTNSNYNNPGSVSATHANVVALFGNNVADNAVNVYVGASVGLSGGAGRIWLTPDVFQNTIPFKYVILHETGHLLGLMHTFSGQYTFDDLTIHRPTCHIDVPNAPWMNVLKKPTYTLPFSSIEAVTRDITNSNYNADSTGDMVADTDAIFFGYRNNLCRVFPAIGGLLYDNWIEDPRVVDYTGNTTTSVYYCFNTFTKYSYTIGNTYYTTSTNGIDQTSNNLVYTTVPLGTNTWQSIVNTILINCSIVNDGETYKCTNSVAQNYMGQIDDVQRNNFTPGQKQRIRECLLGNINNVFNDLSNSLALNEDGTANTDCLYEPFGNGQQNASNPAAGYAYSRTYSPALNNTGANVWNCGPFGARFQTGFDCEFSNALGQIVSQTPYQQYNTTLHGSLGVKIPILGQDIHYTVEPLCFGSFEPFIYGDIKSLSNLASPVMDIKELSPAEAIDPNLLEELERQKYHIISKETESGYKNQKIIYKN